ncbi:MAG: CRTAC1 family protein [Crocosphaera sp.]|nr:CRTAC1 family protein [Crocosphaera sp.]
MTIACAVTFFSSLDTTNNWFTREQLNIKGYNLWDIGVTDINNDHNLDIFSSNHTAPYNLMIGNGQGKFTDVLTKWKFGHNPEFPGFTDSDVEPLIEDPGLYIYWYRRLVFIRAHGIGKDDLLSGRIEIDTPSTIKQKHLAKTNVTTQETVEDSILLKTTSTIEFTVQDNGWFAIAPDTVGLPISFKLNNKIPLNRIYLGMQRIQPPSHNFVIPPLRDRHAMSWADYDGNGWIDVFISRSFRSARESKDQLKDVFRRHLLSNNGKSFEDKTEESSLTESACRAKRNAWVDFDQDDRLDLHVMCMQTSLIQLLKQEPNGKFVDVSAKVGLATKPYKRKNKKSDGAFVWLDADNDGDMDLLLEDKGAFRLYVNQSGVFESKSFGKTPKGLIKKFIVSDYDLDGDLDVFAPSEYRNTLLLNTDGNYKLIDPTTVGLPATSLTANWVDYDNDGLVDIHTVPNGLYRQRQDHRFEATRLLGNEFSSSLMIEPICNWFDADNDGSRDLLMTVNLQDDWKLKQKQKIENKTNEEMRRYLYVQKRLNDRDQNMQWRWTSYLYLNHGSKNHWLQVKLMGSQGNRQALGAKVTVITPNNSYLQQVGSAEGSNTSQGHYRLYFGLGEEENVTSVKIVWPDGQLQEIQDPKSDQLLIIERESLTYSPS